MSNRARERKLGDALRAVLGHKAGATRYDHYQPEFRRGSARRPDGPHPREYDANGFPVPQRTTSFVERVARLRNAL
jgi:hypothetical protein